MIKISKIEKTNSQIKLIFNRINSMQNNKITYNLIKVIAKIIKTQKNQIILLLIQPKHHKINKINFFNL